MSAGLPAEAVAYSPDNRCCQWIVNDGRPWFCCAAPRMSLKPYCAGHMLRAYHRGRRAEHDGEPETGAVGPLRQAADAVPAVPAPMPLAVVPTGAAPAPIARRYTTDGRRRWA